MEKVGSRGSTNQRSRPCFGCGRMMAPAKNGRPRVVCGNPECARIRQRWARVNRPGGVLVACYCQWCGNRHRTGEAELANPTPPLFDPQGYLWGEG